MGWIFDSVVDVEKEPLGWRWRVQQAQAATSSREEEVQGAEARGIRVSDTSLDVVMIPKMKKSNYHAQNSTKPMQRLITPNTNSRLKM